jgi:hypothetical protein
MTTIEEILSADAVVLVSNMAGYLPHDEGCNGAQKDIICVSINARACRSKLELLREIASRLSFPEYFGHNWDALEECLQDMDWLDARSVILLICGADALLSLHEDLGVLVRITDSVGRSWSTEHQGGRFRVVLDAEDQSHVRLEEACRTVGVDVLRLPV